MTLFSSLIIREHEVCPAMVSTDIMRKVSKLARLHLTEDELEEFTKDAKEVLEIFAILEKAPVDEGVFVPLLPTSPLESTRADEEIELLCTPQAIDISPHKQDNYFKGPRSL